MRPSRACVLKRSTICADPDANRAGTDITGLCGKRFAELLRRKALRALEVQPFWRAGRTQLTTNEDFS